MNKASEAILKRLIQDVPALDTCKESIIASFEILKQCYAHKGKVLICGNGGSAADSEHIVGELMKGFVLKRKISQTDRVKILNAFPQEGEHLSDNLQGALPAISLVSQIAISSAFINDVAPDMVFAQQVYGYAAEGDVLIAISTSGNAENVINALKTAKSFGVKRIGLTGREGGGMKEICDVSIIAPAVETYRIQEYHISIYHALCAMIEAEFFDN